MKEIKITTKEELVALDLAHSDITEDTSIDIRLRVENDTIDYPVRLTHTIKGKSSKLYMKLALFGKSKVNIPVEIHVKKGAFDIATDFKALVYIMSADASASVTPGLFIEEKNIQSASHGVVIKNIKDADLVYIQARGILKQEAKNMVVQL